MGQDLLSLGCSTPFHVSGSHTGLYHYYGVCVVATAHSSASTATEQNVWKEEAQARALTYRNIRASHGKPCCSHKLDRVGNWTLDRRLNESSQLTVALLTRPVSTRHVQLQKHNGRGKGPQSWVCFVFLKILLEWMCEWKQCDFDSPVLCSLVEHFTSGQK